MLCRFSSSLAAFLSCSSKLLAQKLKRCSTMSEISHIYEIMLHRFNHKPTCLFLPPLNLFHIIPTFLPPSWAATGNFTTKYRQKQPQAKNLSQFSHQATSVQGHFAICMTPKLMLREDGVFVRDVSRVWLKQPREPTGKFQVIFRLFSGHLQVLQNKWLC